MPQDITYASIETPGGPVRASLVQGAVTALDWVASDVQDSTDLAVQVRAQLTEYFAGARTAFDLPLAPRANAFQARFYDVLCAIPYGHTRTYGEIAQQMGASAQAIGQACGGNPIPVLIPCHRVLGANGLGGFSARGGVETKVMLLRLEGAAGLLI